MRRLLTSLVSFAVVVSGLVSAPPTLADECGPEDPYDRPQYTFYWYDCRRSETPDPDLLPYLDPETGALTICVDRFKVHGSLTAREECRTVNLMTGTVPSHVCVPASAGPLGVAAPCLPLPSFGAGGGEAPKDFPYEDFQACTPDGSTCRSTFWAFCLATGTPRTLPSTPACVGAGVEFTDRHNPARGVERVCVGVGTPLDPPGTWTIACAPVDKLHGKGGRGNGKERNT